MSDFVVVIRGWLQKENKDEWVQLNRSVCAGRLIYCNSSQKRWMKTSVRLLTGRKSNLTHPYGNSICPYSDPTPRTTSHRTHRKLFSHSSTERLWSGSGERMNLKSDEGGVDTEMFSDPKQEVQTCAMHRNLSLGVHSWQKVQELSLNLGAWSVLWSQRNLNSRRLCLVWLADYRLSLRGGRRTEIDADKYERFWLIYQM